MSKPGEKCPMVIVSGNSHPELAQMIAEYAFYANCSCFYAVYRLYFPWLFCIINEQVLVCKNHVAWTQISVNDEIGLRFINKIIKL